MVQATDFEKAALDCQYYSGTTTVLGICFVLTSISNRNFPSHILPDFIIPMQSQGQANRGWWTDQPRGADHCGVSSLTQYYHGHGAYSTLLGYIRCPGLAVSVIQLKQRLKKIRDVSVEWLERHVVQNRLPMQGLYQIGQLCHLTPFHWGFTSHPTIYES